MTSFSILFENSLVIVSYFLFFTYYFYATCFQLTGFDGTGLSEIQIYNSTIQKYRNCAAWRFARLGDIQTWLHLESIVNQCSPRRLVKAKGYKNYEGTKYFQKPSRNCTIITLGIGEDVQAEMKMKQDHPNCQFFGADPVEFVNAQIYSHIGKYHKIAVGVRNRVEEALVLRSRKIVSENVKFMSLPVFLKTFIRRKVIDLLLLDVEYAEYEMFPYFYLDSEINKSGVVICQINMEIHKPMNFAHYFKTGNFIRQILTDGVYNIVEASSSGHLRLYLSRINDKRCI